MTLFLLRHTEVSAHCRGRCYGRYDVPLSGPGRLVARRLAGAFDTAALTVILASPSRRARLLGALIARRQGCGLALVPDLQERDFGSWEGACWDTIWQQEGEAMNGMIDAPATYRPGGGETTAELGARVLAWFKRLPTEIPVLAVSHGGPIAALAGTLLEQAPRQWLAHVPPCGHGIRISRDGLAWRVTPWQPELAAAAPWGKQAPGRGANRGQRADKGQGADPGQSDG